jgi:Protein kinase domain
MLIPLPSNYGYCVGLFRWERVLATGVGGNVVEDLQPGDPPKIGPYRLVGRLGQGGMGQVFLGVSPGGRPVAVKFIRPDLAADPRFRVRFGREVAAARRVSGMFTAMVVDADVDGPVAWLATAYVPGPSLSEAVESHGPLPEASLLALAAGLAESLIAIHAAGVIHRDLKPSNVLLAEDGPRVIDFGISRAAAESTALTQTGLVVGSPGFMSPEQAMGGAVGPSSDIFTLGAVLAFAATGQGPFGTGTTVTLLYRVVHGSPDLEQVPPAVRPLIERCLAKNPAQRPTADELLAEAGALQVGGSWLPESITRTFVRDPGLGPTAASAGAGLAGLGLGYAAATSPAPESGQAPSPDAVATQTTALGSASYAPAASDSAATTPGIAPPPPGGTQHQPAAAGTGGGGRPRPRHRFLRPLVLGWVAGAVFAISGATAFAVTSFAGEPPAPHQSPAAQISAVPAGASQTTSGAPASAGATTRAAATHPASGSVSSSAFTSASASASGAASRSASPSPTTSGSGSASTSASASPSPSPSSVSSSSSSPPPSPTPPASSSPPAPSPSAPASSSAPPPSPSAQASTPSPGGS